MRASAAAETEPRTAAPAADYVSKEEPQTRIGAVLGLGLAYAGREKAEVRRWWEHVTQGA